MNDTKHRKCESCGKVEILFGSVEASATCVDKDGIEYEQHRRAEVCPDCAARIFQEAYEICDSLKITMKDGTQKLFIRDI